MPHILLTNDDGIAAPGLAALADALAGLGPFTIAAPSGERSGAAHSISVRRAVACEPRGEGRWSIDGTPADSVIIALHKLLESKPGLVISGINHGANIGQNIHYSGTVGAAMEATLHHIPALALSVASRNPVCDFGPAAWLGRQLARLVLEEPLPDGVLLNVNVPEKWEEAGRVRFTRQSRRITRNALREERGPGGASFWIEEIAARESIEPDSDLAALQAGEATITPVCLPGTHEISLNHLSHLAARLESLLHNR
ncbi:MAG TPA: 5'/3'-nucleotidase SurE [Candidatus Dormibacteraeota bacterium]|nr:5'/3'-nucleotidase SurE [Candidatus Dormibacteraeota bacterium]